MTASLDIAGPLLLPPIDASRIDVDGFVGRAWDDVAMSTDFTTELKLAILALEHDRSTHPHGNETP